MDPSFPSSKYCVGILNIPDPTVLMNWAAIFPPPLDHADIFLEYYPFSDVELPKPLRAEYDFFIVDLCWTMLPNVSGGTACSDEGLTGSRLVLCISFSSSMKRGPIASHVRACCEQAKKQGKCWSERSTPYLTKTIGSIFFLPSNRPSFLKQPIEHGDRAGLVESYCWLKYHGFTTHKIREAG